MQEKIIKRKEKMNDFESKACKFLGADIFVLVIFITFQVMGCTCVNSIEPPIEPEYIDEVDTKHLT